MTEIQDDVTYRLRSKLPPALAAYFANDSISPDLVDRDPEPDVEGAHCLLLGVALAIGIIATGAGLGCLAWVIWQGILFFLNFI